jgi:TPR repeat protein
VGQALKAAQQDPKVPRDRDECLKLLRRGLIPWLAGIDPQTNLPRRKVARLSQVPEEARALITHFIEHRLLATDTDENQQTTVEPAHEALLRQWGKLRGWLEEDAAALSTLETVKSASRDWEANERESKWLIHQTGRLEDAEALHQRQDLAANLDPSDRSYLAECRKHEDERRDKELRQARELAESRQREFDAQRRASRRTLVGSVIAVCLALVVLMVGMQAKRSSDELRTQSLIRWEQGILSKSRTSPAEALAETVALSAEYRGSYPHSYERLLHELGSAFQIEYGIPGGPFPLLTAHATGDSVATFDGSLVNWSELGEPAGGISLASDNEANERIRVNSFSDAHDGRIIAVGVDPLDKTLIIADTGKEEGIKKVPLKDTRAPECIVTGGGRLLIRVSAVSEQILIAAKCPPEVNLALLNLEADVLATDATSGGELIDARADENGNWSLLLSDGRVGKWSPAMAEPDHIQFPKTRGDVQLLTVNSSQRCVLDTLGDITCDWPYFRTFRTGLSAAPFSADLHPEKPVAIIGDAKGNIAFVDLSGQAEPFIRQAHMGRISSVSFTSEGDTFTTTEGPTDREVGMGIYSALRWSWRNDGDRVKLLAELQSAKPDLGAPITASTLDGNGFVQATALEADRYILALLEESGKMIRQIQQEGRPRSLTALKDGSAYLVDTEPHFSSVQLDIHTQRTLFDAGLNPIATFEMSGVATAGNNSFYLIDNEGAISDLAPLRDSLPRNIGKFDHKLPLIAYYRAGVIWAGFVDGVVEARNIENANTVPLKWLLTQPARALVPGPDGGAVAIGLDGTAMLLLPDGQSIVSPDLGRWANIVPVPDRDMLAGIRSEGMVQLLTWTLDPIGSPIRWGDYERRWSSIAPLSAGALWLAEADGVHGERIVIDGSRERLLAFCDLINDWATRQIPRIEGNLRERAFVACDRSASVAGTDAIPGRSRILTYLVDPEAEVSAGLVESRLMRAARLGRDDLLSRFLEEGDALESRDAFARSVLDHAVLSGDSAAVQLLLGKISVSQESLNGLVEVAATYQFNRVGNVLLDAGAAREWNSPSKSKQYTAVDDKWDPPDLDASLKVWVDTLRNDPSDSNLTAAASAFLAFEGSFKWYANYQLGRLYDFGAGVAHDSRRAHLLQLDAARKGYPPAANSIGSDFLNGDGVFADEERGCGWFEKAGLAGLNNLGVCYESGDGRALSLDLARELFTRAYDNGESHSALNLALLLESMDVPVAEWRAAAESAVANGQAQAALLLSEHTKGSESRRWLIRAAELGGGEATLRLAIAALDDGQYQDAERWFGELLERHDSVFGAYKLGELNERELVRGASLVAAQRFYEKAISTFANGTRHAHDGEWEILGAGADAMYVRRATMALEGVRGRSDI